MKRTKLALFSAAMIALFVAAIVRAQSDDPFGARPRLLKPVRSLPPDRPKRFPSTTCLAEQARHKQRSRDHRTRHQLRRQIFSAHRPRLPRPRHSRPRP